MDVRLKSKRFEREEREGVVFVLAIGSCGRRKTKSCLGFRFRV